MKNLANIKKVLDHIEANLHLWDQNYFHSECGTKHCFAGWAEVFMTGDRKIIWKTRQTARMFYGFSKREADYYFDQSRTFCDLKTALEPFFDEKGFGRDGYDRFGFDRNGYDQNGYDRFGYDRSGYNRFGCDRNGYDRFGFDRFGFDRFGYDRFGYDRFGYNRDGYDLDNLDIYNNPKPI